MKKVINKYLYICGILFIIGMVSYCRDKFGYSSCDYDYDRFYNTSVISDRSVSESLIPSYIKEMEQDSAFIIARHSNQSTSHDSLYWIVDKKNISVYGPIEIPRFNHLCDSLGIKLRFKEEKK